MHRKLLLILCSILLSFAVQAQKESNLLKFSGKVQTTDSSEVRNAHVTLYKGGQPSQAAEIDREGNFVLYLDVNQVYKIEIACNLYASQRIEVNTTIPDDWRQKVPTTHFGVKLFPFYDKVDFILLDVPVDRLVYNKYKNKFVRDRAYFNRTKLQIEMLEKGLEVVTRKEKHIYNFDLPRKEKPKYVKARQIAYDEYIEEMLDRVYGDKKVEIVALQEELKRELDESIERRKKKELEALQQQIKKQEVKPVQEEAKEEFEEMIDTMPSDSILTEEPQKVELQSLDLFVETPNTSIELNDLEMIITETEDEGTVVDLPALTQEEIKQSIELVEIISEKAVSNTVIEQLETQREEEERITRQNIKVKARSKRKFFELIAETVREDKKKVASE